MAEFVCVETVKYMNTEGCFDAKLAVDAKAARTPSQSDITLLERSWTSRQGSDSLKNKFHKGKRWTILWSNVAHVYIGSTSFLAKTQASRPLLSAVNPCATTLTGFQ
ncbi:hypothetical protein PHMEG_0003742 [Phytophthora megakarya]|uniref:Uncharacterized protein n=1 Tax=Phytophthora megakarya TaxID=4795 RepID=A0A225WVH2_9STRA|nr:hypothetical protein PHMEG_0003742 [Phytophthora megakarya]